MYGATVYPQVGPGDEACPIGYQEIYRCRNVIGAAPTAQGNAVDKRGCVRVILPISHDG